MSKYQFNTISNSVKSKEYYNLEEAMSGAERTCLEKQEDVQLWEMPENQFKPNALVYVHWRLLKTYVYEQLKGALQKDNKKEENGTMAREKIALCRMFSGEYWKNPNNIGYESINMFLPDGEQGKTNPISYMYLPANGDYKLCDHEIKYVLLTQHIAKKLKKTGKKKTNESGKEVEEKNARTIVKVIGIAEVCGEIFKNNYIEVNKDDRKCKQYKCIEGGIEFDIMSFLYSKFKGRDISEQDITSDIINEIQAMFSLIPPAKRTGLVKEIFNKSAPVAKLKGLYERSKLLAEIHKKQEPIAEKIEYSKKPLKDLFANNSSFGSLNILLTLKVNNLKFPQRNIYLTNDEKLFSSFILKSDKVFYVDANTSTQNQTTYIDFNKAFIAELLACSGWESAGELNIGKFEKEFEPSFLTLVGKENDEISYSNLFAHFLAFPDFCEKLFNFLGVKNVTPTKIEREEANIDILVKSSNQIVVVENKIKSALNGHSEEDINGEEYRDQLKRYYEYVEGKYKNVKYFIFAPDYNPVNQENFGSAVINGKTIEMKDTWDVVRYSKLLKFCDTYHGFDGTKEEWNFNEFKKALKVHTVESLQNYYREMQIRMRKLFN